MMQSASIALSVFSVFNNYCVYDGTHLPKRVIRTNRIQSDGFSRIHSKTLVLAQKRQVLKI